MFFCTGVCSAGATEGFGLTATDGLSGAVCAPLVEASRPNASIAVNGKDVFTKDLFLLRNELLRDGKRAPETEGSRSDLEPRRRLLPFIFVAVDMQRNIFDQLEVESIAIGNLLRALQ